MEKEKRAAFEAIFNPASIAIIGASTGMKMNGLVPQFIINGGYRGEIYLVSQTKPEIMGRKTYAKVSDIPGPVDYAIILVPAAVVVGVIDDCAAKKVKAVQLFAAGFTESGNANHADLEKELLAHVKKGGMFMVGPNCAGVSVPGKGIAIETDGIIGKPGNIAVLAQSGGNMETMADAGLTRNIRYSKLVSFGNAADLKAADFLEYFKDDPETQIIGCYLEGAGDGRRLLELIRETSRQKPVVVLKGGKTDAGRTMAASHTASMTGSSAVFSAAMKQSGAIELDTMEDLADTLMAFQYLPPLKSEKGIIISQLGGGSGGPGVIAADLATRAGIQLPPFSGRETELLKTVIDAVGTIVQNPMDTSMVSRDPAKLESILDILADMPESHFILLMERPTFLLNVGTPESLRKINEVMAAYRKKHKKPLIVISVPGGKHEAERVAVENYLTGAGIPVFPSFDRACRALMRVVRWNWRRQSIVSGIMFKT